MPFAMSSGRLSMSQPVKRGPGRPRKQQPAPAPAFDATPDTVAADFAAEEPDKPKKNDDPRIGMDCDPSWSSVGYGDDGSTYRCENGKIVERVL